MDISPKPIHNTESPRTIIVFVFGLILGLIAYLSVNFIGQVMNSAILTVSSYLILGSTLVTLIMYQKNIRQRNVCDVCEENKGKENLDVVIMDENNKLRTFDICGNCKQKEKTEIIPENEVKWDWTSMRLKHGK